MGIIYSLKNYLYEKIVNLVGEVKGLEIKRSPIKSFDYSTNIFFLNKDINKEQFKNHLLEDKIIESLSISNNFLNIKLNRREALRKVIESFLIDKWESYNLGNGKKVLIEFVSANPTGPLNAVNGRSATFGLVLSNVLKYFEYNVFREYYVNDIGEQIEKLVDSFIERIKEVEGKDFHIPEDGYKGEYLKDLAIYFVNSDLKRNFQSREEIKHFVINYFINQHKETLRRFGLEFDNWFMQSSLKNIDETIQKLSEKGFIYEKDGAIYFKSTEFGDDKDRVIKKTKGRVDFTYFAYDIEYIKNKYERGFDSLITILGPDHYGYINRLKAATKALNYDNHDIIILQIVNIVEKDKTLKMSKRKGILVLLSDLMEKVDPVFLRYFFISRLKDSHIDLDLDFINKLSLDNPLYYIFYVYARICGIIRNYNKTIPSLEEIINLDVELIDDEFELFLNLQEFRDALLSSLNDPYYLTLWAYNFAQTFHKFYNQHKVLCEKELGEKKEKLRIGLILFSKGILDKWGELLKIKLPEKM